MICASCRLPLAPGEALRLTSLEAGRSVVVHRPSLRGFALCFRHASGRRSDYAVSLMDPAAALARDHEHGGSDVLADPNVSDYIATPSKE